MVRIEYSTNNSGGVWWLEDHHWYSLAKAGWDVEWVEDDEFYKGEERFLGALAMHASKEFPSIREAIREWEQVTGLTADGKGCSCCRAPHSFSEGGEYVSGCDATP